MSARDHDAATCAAAWENIAAARAALALWVLALPPDGISDDNAARVQVAMCGISKLLSEARDHFDNVPGGSGISDMGLLIACGFADMADSALWNYMDGTGAAAPAVGDLAATAHQALSFLAKFAQRHQAARGAARSTSARPGAEGGAA